MKRNAEIGLFTKSSKMALPYGGGYLKKGGILRRVTLVCNTGFGRVAI
jgi:hypothetical protein